MHAVFMCLLARCALVMFAAYRGPSISLPREQGSSGLLAEREKAGEAKELLRGMVLTTEGSVMSCFTMTCMCRCNVHSPNLHAWLTCTVYTTHPTP